MKPRGLLAAVIVLAALGGALWWSNRKQKTDAAKPVADTTTKILSIPEDQIKEVTIKKTGAETTVLRKGDDGKWQIAEPKPQRADQDTAKSLIGSLATLNADKVVEDKAADLAPYGLTVPTLDVTVLKKDGKSQDFLVGDDTPTGCGAYAKLAGDAHVYTIASYVKTGIDKTPNDLRDKRLLTFDQDKLTRVDLQPVKGETVEFGKNNQNDWQILKPKPARAEGRAEPGRADAGVGLDGRLGAFQVLFDEAARAKVIASRRSHRTCCRAVAKERGWCAEGAGAN